MRFKVGQLVHEGGPEGPISRIVDIDGDCFVLESVDSNSRGWLESEYLYPVKVFEQLKLF